MYEPFRQITHWQRGTWGVTALVALRPPNVSVQAFDFESSIDGAESSHDEPHLVHVVRVINLDVPAVRRSGSQFRGSAQSLTEVPFESSGLINIAFRISIGELRYQPPSFVTNRIST